MAFAVAVMAPVSGVVPEANAAVTSSSTGTITINNVPSDLDTFEAFRFITYDIDAGGTPIGIQFLDSEIEAIAYDVCYGATDGGLCGNLGDSTVISQLLGDADFLNQFNDGLESYTFSGNYPSGDSFYFNNCGATGTCSVVDAPLGVYMIYSTADLDLGEDSKYTAFNPIMTSVEPVLNEAGDDYIVQNGVVDLNDAKYEFTPGITKVICYDQYSCNSGMIQGSAFFGNLVGYQLTVDVPRYPDNATYTTFQVTDSPGTSGALTPDVGAINVRGDGNTLLTSGVEYVISAYDTHGFKIDFDYAEVSRYETITISYSARLIGSATMQPYPNTATLTYNSDPSTSVTAMSTGLATLYSYGVEVSKVDGYEDALPGVEFELYNCKDGGCDGVDDMPLYFVGSDGDYQYNNAGQPRLVADQDGKINIIGLAEGMYLLVETDTLPGYDLADPVTFTIEAGVGQALVNDPDPNTVGIYDITVTNYPILGIPNTGGMGRMTLFIIGGVLMVGSVAAVLVYKKATKAEKK